MGKSSPPPAPDYAGAAKETAAGNLGAARYATQANRPTQITPYGTSTWTQGPETRTFNQQRYDAAVKAAQEAARPAPAPSGMAGPISAEETSYTPNIRDIALGRTPAASTGGFQMPDRNDSQFYDVTPSDQWTQNVTLDPTVQQTLNKQMDLSNRYADLATTGLNKAYDTLSDPTLDMSQIPQRPINPGQTAQEAIMARLAPQFQQQEEALRTRLANQGITDPGSQAYQNDFRNFNQGRNDAEMQAALYGIGLDNQNRSSALQEQAYLQDRPLNLINALRTGAQVQNPQFANFAQQATTAGPDMTSAANATGNWNLANYNADQASSNALMGGLFSLGSAAMGMPAGGGLFSLFK